MKKLIAIFSTCLLFTSCTSRFNESVDHLKNTVTDNRYVGTTHPNGYFIDKQYNVICYTYKAYKGGGIGCARLKNEQ